MLIDKVYKAVQLIAAKDHSSGYISPLSFNRAAELAQLDIITEKYNSLQVPAFGSNYNMEEMFSILKVSTPLPVSGGLAAKPSDFLLYSASHAYVIFNGEGRVTQIDMVNDSEWLDRLMSEIDKPNLFYPIGRMIGSNIEVKPDDINQITLTYLKVPLEPWWNYTASGKVLTFVESGGSTTNPNSGVTAGDSTDFTLTESEFSMIVWKICKYVGIEIRETDLYQLVGLENKSDE